MINEILIYSIVSFLGLFIFSKISYKLNLLDIPNKRKKHSESTAYTGGLIISFIYIASILIFNVKNQTLNSILTIGLLISIVGFIDDKYQLGISGKLSLQIIPIIYLIIIESLNLTQLGSYNNFNLELNSFSMPFTLLAAMFLINAFNYFDGLDGTLSFTVISVIIILYFLSSDQNIKLFLVILLLPLLIFLFFNFSIFKLPKLFLGDSGSLLLGFIISFILIYLANKNWIHPILLAWSIVIFVYEFLSINLIRIGAKKDPFKAGQDHLHHILFENTKSIFLTNLFIFSMNIILFMIGDFSFLLISPLASLIVFVLFFIIFLILRNKYSKKKVEIKIN